MRRKIQAGAGVENLRLRCPYFYDVALALHATDGAPSVADLVISTFRSRYKVRLIASVSPPHLVLLQFTKCTSVNSFVESLFINQLHDLDQCGTLEGRMLSPGACG